MATITEKYKKLFFSFMFALYHFICGKLRFNDVFVAQISSKLLNLLLFIIIHEQLFADEEEEDGSSQQRRRLYPLSSCLP